MNGADVLMIVTAVLAVIVLVKFVLVRATGSYCELHLKEFVDEDEVVVAVYACDKDGIDVEKTLVCGESVVPQSIRCIVDKFGNAYMKFEYTLVSIELVIILTLCTISILFKLYTSGIISQYL